jgi:hypothetical protein
MVPLDKQIENARANRSDHINFLKIDKGVLLKRIKHSSYYKPYYAVMFFESISLSLEAVWELKIF